MWVTEVSLQPQVAFTCWDCAISSLTELLLEHAVSLVLFRSVGQGLSIAHLEQDSTFILGLFMA